MTPEIVVTDRFDGENTLEWMRDIIKKHGDVTFSDLKDLVGLKPTHKDTLVGWKTIEGAEVKKVENGFLLDLPPMVNLND